jgi:copper chaperone CopZ
VAGAGSANAGSVEVKGPHICCGQCVNIAKKILAKVEGVSEVTADAKTKIVAFTAKDSAAAKAGVKALFDGGFYGKATEDGKAIKVDVAGAKKGDKVTKVAVSKVHVCCGACKNAIKAIFKGSTISYEGKGPQPTVIIEGADLEASAVLSALRKAGFNGTIKK